MGPGLSARSSLTTALKLPRSLSQLLTAGVTSPRSASPRTRSGSPEQRPVPPPQAAPRREASSSADCARKQPGTRPRVATGSSSDVVQGEACPQGNGKRQSQHCEPEQPQGRHEAQLQALRNEMQGKDEWQTFVVPRKPKPRDGPPPPASPRPLEDSSLLEDSIETSPIVESPTLGSDYEDEELELARKAVEDSINAVNASEQKVAELQKAWEDGQVKEDVSEALAEVPSMCGHSVEEEGYSCSPADPVQLAEDLQLRWQQLDVAARAQLVRMMLTPVGEDGKVARAG